MTFHDGNPLVRDAQGPLMAFWVFKQNIDRGTLNASWIIWRAQITLFSDTPRTT
jgi:hypothetical protein